MEKGEERERGSLYVLQALWVPEESYFRSCVILQLGFTYQRGAMLHSGTEASSLVTQ